MPNSRPRIEFNKKGVCNACTNYIEKQSIDWAERKKLFLNKTIISNFVNVKFTLY